MASEPTAKPPEVTHPPERRHITALAVELLATENINLPADPEELYAFVDAYRHYVAGVVARHGGVIKEAHGREVVVFFGYPLVQEHVVERAIHAALALVGPGSKGSSTWEFPPGEEDEAILPNGFAVRVGVASGLVIAGSAGEVLGETPGDATKLLSVAEPGQVIIAAGTRRLSGSLFAYREIGPVTIRRRRRSGTGLAGARSERDQQPFRGTLFGQFDATRRPRGGADVAVTCLAAGQIR